MFKLICCGFSLLFPVIGSTYTQWDGKPVPQLPPPPANAIYVSTYAQLRTAMTNQTAGQTVVLTGASYFFTTALKITVDNFTLRGNSDDPAQCIIRGKGYNNSVDCEEELIQLENNCSNVTIADLTISEARCHGIKIASMGNNNVLVHNVRFKNIGERKIKGPAPNPILADSESYYSHNWEIRYCHFEDTAAPPAVRCGTSIDSSGDYIAGMDIMFADSWNVHDCVFRNIRGSGGDARGAIFFWNRDRNMTVERNTFIGCDRAIAFGNGSGTLDVMGGIIRNNFIYKGPATISRGIEIDHSSNIKVYNNTLFSNCTDVHNCFRTIEIFNNGPGVELRNNILFGSMSNLGGPAPADVNNLWLQAASDYNTTWFVNKTNADLHLVPGVSQVIDAGQVVAEVTEDWEGQARDATPDIGADEFGNVIAIEEASAVSAPAVLRVEPNPFNPSARIVGSRQLAVDSKKIQVLIYNVHGDLVGNLTAAGRQLPAGVTWDASHLPGGVYFVTVKAGAFRQSAKAVLLK